MFDFNIIIEKIYCKHYRLNYQVLKLVENRNHNAYICKH